MKTRRFGWIVAMLVAGSLYAEELPKLVQDQLAAMQPALVKAQKEYQKKIQAENAKLIFVIQRAMEKAAKAGEAEELAALKAAHDKASSGELLRPWFEPKLVDLLPHEAPGADGVAVIAFTSGDPVDTLAPNKAIHSNRDYLISEVSEELKGLSYLRRPFKEPEACSLKVLKGGVLYLAVGDPPDGLDFPGMGFRPTTLYIQSATGRHTIVSREVRAGETFTLPPSAKVNSFPIFQAK